jgi:hypothetical protein
VISDDLTGTDLNFVFMIFPYLCRCANEQSLTLALSLWERELPSPLGEGLGMRVN